MSLQGSFVNTSPRDDKAGNRSMGLRTLKEERHDVEEEEEDKSY
jgi:hypothetical protein